MWRGRRARGRGTRRGGAEARRSTCECAPHNPREVRVTSRRSEGSGGESWERSAGQRQPRSPPADREDPPAHGPGTGRVPSDTSIADLCPQVDVHPAVGGTAGAHSHGPAPAQGLTPARGRPPPPPPPSTRREASEDCEDCPGGHRNGPPAKVSGPAERVRGSGCLSATAGG